MSGVRLLPAALLLLCPAALSQNAAMPAPSVQYTDDGAMLRPNRCRNAITSPRALT